MIETVDDVVEQIADWIGVYGSCNEEICECESIPFCCRTKFVCDLTNRIRHAALIEIQLGLLKVKYE